MSRPKGWRSCAPATGACAAEAAKLMAARPFRRMASAQAAADLRQPHEHAARRAEIERQNVSLEDARLALKAQKGGDRGFGIGLRQLDVEPDFSCRFHRR